MSNRAHRQAPAPPPVDKPQGRWRRARLFIAWFFAPRVAPSAWQRRPYMRNRNRRPGKFTR